MATCKLNIYIRTPDTPGVRVTEHGDHANFFGRLVDMRLRVGIIEVTEVKETGRMAIALVAVSMAEGEDTVPDAEVESTTRAAVAASEILLLEVLNGGLDASA